MHLIDILSLFQRAISKKHEIGVGKNTFLTLGPLFDEVLCCICGDAE